MPHSKSKAHLPSATFHCASQQHELIMVSEFFAEIIPTASPNLHMLQALYLPLRLFSVLHTYGL